MSGIDDSDLMDLRRQPTNAQTTSAAAITRQIPTRA